MSPHLFSSCLVKRAGVKILRTDSFGCTCMLGITIDSQSLDACPLNAKRGARARLSFDRERPSFPITILQGRVKVWAQGCDKISADPCLPGGCFFPTTTTRSW